MVPHTHTPRLLVETRLKKGWVGNGGKRKGRGSSLVSNNPLDGNGEASVGRSVGLVRVRRSAHNSINHQKQNKQGRRRAEGQDDVCNDVPRFSYTHTHTNTDTRIYRGETSVCRVVAGLAALEGAVINSVSVQQLRKLLYCSTSTYFEFPRKSIVLQFLEVLGIEFYRKRTRFTVMYVTPQSSNTFLELQKLLLNRISQCFIICGSFGDVFTFSIAPNAYS